MWLSLLCCLNKHIYELDWLDKGMFLQSLHWLFPLWKIPDLTTADFSDDTTPETKGEMFYPSCFMYWLMSLLIYLVDTKVLVSPLNQRLTRKQICCCQKHQCADSNVFYWLKGGLCELLMYSSSTNRACIDQQSLE